MENYLTWFNTLALIQDSKKKKKTKDDDSDKDKKAKKEKKKKDKDKNDSESGKDYIKEALNGGKKNEDDFAAHTNDEESIGSEAGVDDEAALDLAVEATKTFLSENTQFSIPQVVEFVTNQQMASSLKSFDKIHILVRASIGPNFFKNKEIPKIAPAVSAITSGNKIMERHLIAALEAICVNKTKNFPVMLKQFYDVDALDEETILEWADEGRSVYTLSSVDEEVRAELRGEAEPLIVWLQEAESEDESSAGE